MRKVQEILERRKKNITKCKDAEKSINEIKNVISFSKIKSFPAIEIYKIAEEFYLEANSSKEILNIMKEIMAVTSLCKLYEVLMRIRIPILKMNANSVLHSKSHNKCRIFLFIYQNV